MKKYLLSFLFCLLFSFIFVCAVSAADASFIDTDKVEWFVSLNEENSTACIKGIKTDARTNNFNIPSTVVLNEKEYTVTSIAVSAFENNQNVFGKVTFPENLTEIGEKAFKNTNIYGDIIIPDSVVLINKNAFDTCKGISTVTLPNGITKIESEVFANCISLKEVKTNGIITEFGSKSFKNCYALQAVPLSENTQYIGNEAFRDCYCLNGKIDLCNAIKIDTNAFYGCKGISSFVLGDTDISVNAFFYCTSLKSFSSDVESSYYKIIDGVLFNKNGSSLLIYPSLKKGEEYTVPSTVSGIGEMAFVNTVNLKKVIFDDNLTNIGRNSFYKSNIESVCIPDNVTLISDGAFSYCPELKWIVLGNSVSTLGGGLVSNSPKLEIIISKNSELTNSISFKNFNWINSYDCTEHFYGYKDIAETCESSGKYVCVVCGDEKTADPLGHTGKIIETSSLSCLTDEYRIIECTRCKQTVKIVSKEHEGHKKVKLYDVNTDSESYTLYKCLTCKSSFIENYQSKNYTVGDINNNGVVDETDLSLLSQYLCNSNIRLNFLSADINNDGTIDITDYILLDKYISDPDSVSVSYENRSCKNHIHLKNIDLVKKCCNYDGLSLTVCMDCGTVVNSRIVPHTDCEIVVEETITPTCTQKGMLIGHCKYCNERMTQELEKSPHTQHWWTLPEKGYEYNICQVCGAFESRDVDYSVLDNIIKNISSYYKQYYTAESIALVKPIFDNYEKSLTQEQVNSLVRQIEEALPQIQFNTKGVPTVYIETDNKLSKEYSDAHINVVNLDDNGVYHSVTEFNGKIKVRGNSTANPTKYPFNIKFNKDVDLLGMGGGNKYCLLANLYDNTLLRNAIAMEFAKSIGLEYTPDYRFVDVYVNGQYNGNYLLVTPVDVDENRVDIDKKTDYLLGLDPNRYDENINELYITSPIFKTKMLVESPEDISPSSLSNLYNIYNQIDYAILSGDFEEVKKFVDVDSMAKYFILQDFLKNKDYLYDSTRFYIKDGKLSGGPIWDYDLSMGNVSVNSGGDANSGNTYWNDPNTKANGIEGNSATGSWADSKWRSGDTYVLWFYYLCEYCPDFVSLYKEYYLKYQDKITILYESTYNSKGKIEQVNFIDKIIKDKDINTSITENYEKYSVASSYTDLSYNECKTFSDAVRYLRSWLQERNEWLLAYYFPDKYQYPVDTEEDNVTT